MTKIQIPGKVEMIINKLNDNGFEAFAVGGCVRDSLLGKEPEDWDITTSAKPAQVKAVFGRTIDTGIRHGTVTVMVNRSRFEVTTYRIDGEYQDGRHPDSVEFTSNLLEDLKRRDFTINAMAYNHASGIIDAFGGMKDLEEKVVRCVGDPMERFAEDALRILRAVRFSAQLGFSIDQATKDGIGVIAPNLAKVSKERIQVELTKLLLSPHPEQIQMVGETGMGQYVSEHFAGIDFQKAVLDGQVPAVKHMRWAAFLRWQSRQEAEAILRELRMDLRTIAKAGTLAGLWRQRIPAQKPAIRKAMSQVEPGLFDDLLEIQRLFGPGLVAPGEEMGQVREMAREIRQAGDCVRLSQMDLSGKDLVEAGMKPGKELGEVLDRLFGWVLEHPEDNHKGILLEKAMEWLGR